MYNFKRVQSDLRISALIKKVGETGEEGIRNFLLIICAF